MQNGGGGVNDPSSSSPSPKLEPTWIHQIFQGTFTSETRCLNCETVIMNFFMFHPGFIYILKFEHILGDYNMIENSNSVMVQWIDH